MPELLKKISFDPAIPLKAPDADARDARSKRRFPWKILFIPLVVLLVVVGLIGVMLLPMRGVIAAAQEVIAAGKELGAAVKNQDLDKAKSGLAATRGKLTALSEEYKKMSALKAVPWLGAYIQDGEHGITAAFAGLTAGDKAIEALEPNADLLGLKGESKFVSGTADERLQTAVKTMSALTPKVNEMATSIETLRKEIDAIDPNRYPTSLKGIAVRETIRKTKEVIENAANLFVNAQPLLINLPKLLGDKEEMRYLVLFQNDKELRSTGGFITAYAQFRLVKGKAILEKADDIYALDGALKKKFPAPREILTFHKGVYNLNIRDSNLSPDYKLSMQQFEELYDSVSGKEKIDGIWAVDTHVLVEALKILGSVYVYGREFSAETDKRCDCPKAVYELEDYSTRPVGYLRDARKDIIGVLLQTLLQKALGVSPSQYWGQLFQMLLAEINQKHVLAYFHDADAQKAAESFNMAGRIMTGEETATVLKYKEGTWDYLHVNNSNMAGAKSNMFVSQKVTKDVTVGQGGSLTTKLTLEYKNPYPGSDCGLESGGLCLNAPLRNWVRVLVPKSSKLEDSKGAQSPKDNKPVGLETYDALGKTVFEGFLIVNPLGTAKLDLTYTSSVKSSDGKYKILIQKQPGTDGDEYTIKLGGKERKKFELMTDTEVVL
ncbi:DUF4012 domain-containing protein [Candidatus Gottesmanbacteria bacterium]|nr:DUF4012 domain-containing protein [Candidatus Gottesmanbacteria bacterium]